MSRFERCKNTFARVRGNLTSLDDQPLGRGTLVIIMFLDLFILTAIFNGLDEHTRQLSSPDDYIPETCREMVVTREWNPTNRLENLSRIVLSASTTPYRVTEKKREGHPLCEPYLALVERIKKDKGLIGLFEERGRYAREAGELQRRIDSLKGGYDTSLLETVARRDEGQASSDAIRQELQQKTGELNALKARMTGLEVRIDADPNVRQLWDKLQGLKAGERQTLVADLRALNFWYPVRKLGMQLLFLLPLFAAFYAWNSRSIRGNRGLQILVSSHLLVVAFIPIFCKLVETVYDIIPKKLLQRLMELLESFKLVAIWHYLIIGVAVAAALALIYLFQKKLFSLEKTIERRIGRGECQNCGRHLPAGSHACPFCGFVQFTPCGSCGGQRHRYARYCRECGAPTTAPAQVIRDDA